jgi:peptidoglycan hydrolase-like protein with peptidoglycan-binding domain
MSLGVGWAFTQNSHAIPAAPGGQPSIMVPGPRWRAPTLGSEVADSAADGGRRYNRLRRRRIFVLAVVALVVVAVAGALLLATAIKSPAQQAAETKAPAQTQLTVPVQKTVLSTTVLAQAVVGPPREVSPSSIGGGGGSASQDIQQIVTKIYRTSGSYVGQGMVILEVAGQPFFVLQGTVPAYRNLEPGESGEDVSELQEDLGSLGYGLGSDTLGDFGPGTSAAVDAYYQAIGYTAPQVSQAPKADRGAMIPLGQYSFVPRLPAKIVKLDLTVGQSAQGGGLILALGSPVIEGQLSPSSAGLVRPGMKVTITEPGTGRTVRGRVTSVAHSTATTASISGGLYVAMGVQPDRALPLSLVGQDVSVTIATAHSSGPVLAVPEAAVFAGADGRTYVTKVSGAGHVRVPVRVGLTGSGLLQVRADHAGTLTAGDQVIIGENYAASTPAGKVAVSHGGPNGKNFVVTPAGGGG